MALYLTTSATYKIATDSTLAQLVASRSLSVTESVDLEEAVTHHLEVADAASDIAVSMGGLTTCKSLLVISDRQVSIKIDGQSVTIGHTATEGGSLLLPACSFAALLVSNASGAVANVYVCMAGV